MVELGQELSFNDRSDFCLFADIAHFSVTIKQVYPLTRGSYLLDVIEETCQHMWAVVVGESVNESTWL